MMILMTHAVAIAEGKGCFVVETPERAIFYQGDKSAPETWACLGYSTIDRLVEDRGMVFEGDVRAICNGVKFEKRRFAPIHDVLGFGPKGNRKD